MMKIELNRDYRGRIIGDKLLRQGIHEVGTSIGVYLIRKGYAIAVDVDTPLTETEPVPDAPTYDVLNTLLRDAGRPEYAPPVTPDYSTMPNKALKALLDERGIVYGTRDNKATLIGLLDG